MRLKLAGMAGALVLSACNGAPNDEQILAQSCVTLFGDDEDFFDEFIRDSSVDSLESFCGCYASNVVTSETLVPIHKDALTAIIAARTENDLDVENAARRVFAKIESGEIDTLTRSQFDNVGEYLEEIGEGMSNSETCPQL